MELTENQALIKSVLQESVDPQWLSLASLSSQHLIAVLCYQRTAKGLTTRVLGDLEWLRSIMPVLLDLFDVLGREQGILVSMALSDDHGSIRMSDRERLCVSMAKGSEAEIFQPDDVLNITDESVRCFLNEKPQEAKLIVISNKEILSER